MDFFDRQDRARRNTKVLIFYFVLAVVCIILAVYLATLLAFGLAGVETVRPGHGPRFGWWNPRLFGWVTVATVLVVLCGSLYQISALRSGGGAVARALGGRLVLPDTTDPDERKLRNVVEEMSLASGVPVPEIYVLDHEPGINAFAAGHTPSDAAVGVTRGCMTLLKRDELQGVIAHEFSHILNGDMRLNLRLMGIIFGILCLAVIGRILLRTRGRNNPLPLLGLLLILIGWIGVFFGRLIQAAVSRQREFLADAAAVQFTRNPLGLSGALQKIGGLVYGSRVQSENAAQASHLFFGEALKPSFLNAFATHPPLEQRIRAIDPTWDGRFPKVTLPTRETASEAPPQPGRRPPIIPLPQRLAVAAAAAAPAPRVRPQTVLPSLGRPTLGHLRYAEELRAAFPDSVKNAARHPNGAMALIYALLLSGEETTRAAQMNALRERIPAAVWQQLQMLAPEVRALAHRARLPLIELALPALRLMRPDEFVAFQQTLTWLIESDRQVDLLEFVLQKIITRHLATHFGQARPSPVQYYTLRPLLPDCVTLLSALAHVGTSNPAVAERAFRNGLPYLRAPEGSWTLLPREECGLDRVDEALNRLALAVPQIKRNLIEACVHVAGADGVIQEYEAELLRAIADALDSPIPPFVAEQPQERQPPA